jgi:hypothetical protein
MPNTSLRRWTAFMALAAGCGAPSGSLGPRGGSEGGSSAGGTGSGATGGSSIIFNSGTGALPNSGGPFPDGGCAEFVEKAEKQAGGRADVIWALDNSGSMTEEAAGVQANMNFFSQFITQQGIDVHVVVISSGPPVQIIPGIIALDNGVCIDPPLGMPGACPQGDDTNLAAGYMHWRVTVGSNDALLQIQNTFQGWRGMLRPDATKTFVVVTDDEADPPPTAAEFVAWVNQQPEFQGALWRYSGVFCIPGQPVTANCANVGVVHNDLVVQTGGVAAHMGQPDWSAIFQQLADAVVADAVPVSCEWLIPPPPDGEELDPAKVNVRFTPSSGVEETIYGVGDPEGCTADFKGWHYDDPVNPSRLVACPTTCPILQADDNARISVVFGCDTEPPPR